jgi:hypothetical protein
LSYLLDHCSRLLKADVVHESKAVEEFSVKDTKRITQSFHEASKVKLVAAAAAATTEKQPLFQSLITDTLRIISEDEIETKLSNAMSKLPYVINKSAVIADDVVELELQATDLIANLFEFVEYIINGGELRELLVLLKVLFTLLESSSEPESIPFEEKLSNKVLLKLKNTALDSTYSEILLKLGEYGLIGKKDIVDMVNLMTEQDRLQTFDCYPRLLIQSGQPGKLRSLEVQGNAVGFLSGVFVKADSGCSYFEVTLKGCSVGTLGIRVGWGICGSHLSDSDSREILLPGDTADSWTFDGSCGGHLYHNATFIGNTRREEAIVSNNLNGNENKEDCNSDVIGTGNDDLSSVLTSDVAVSEPTVSTGECQKQEVFISEPESEIRTTAEGNNTEIYESNSNGEVGDMIISTTSSIVAADSPASSSVNLISPSANHTESFPSAIDPESSIFASINSAHGGDVKETQPIIPPSTTQPLSLSSSSSESKTVTEGVKDITPSIASSSRSILSREDHFKAFMRTLKVGLDIEVIHSLMTQEGLSEEDIDNFISQEKGNETVGTVVPSLLDETSDKETKKILLQKNRDFIKSCESLEVARVLAYAAGGIVLGNQEDGIVIAESDEEPYPPYPIPCEGKSEINSVSSKDGVVWSTGTVVGCLLNTNTGEISYYVDGKKVGSGSHIDISMKEKLLHGRTLCPVFSCNSTAGLEFNIGQLPFLHEPVLRSSVQDSVVPYPIVSLSDLFEIRTELKVLDNEGNNEKILSSSRSAAFAVVDGEKVGDQQEIEQTLIHPVLSSRKSPYLRLGYIPSTSSPSDSFKSSDSNDCCDMILIKSSKVSVSEGFTVEISTRMLQDPFDESCGILSETGLVQNQILFSFSLFNANDKVTECSLFVTKEGALSFMVKMDNGLDSTMSVVAYTTIPHVVLPLIWNHISLVITTKLNKKQKNIGNILILLNGIPVGSFMSPELNIFLASPNCLMGQMMLGRLSDTTDDVNKKDLIDVTKFKNLDRFHANRSEERDEKSVNLDVVSKSISDGTVAVKVSDFSHWIGDICEFRLWNNARYYLLYGICKSIMLWFSRYLSKYTFYTRCCRS